MMLARTSCFAPRWVGRYRTAMSAARRRQFAFAKGNTQSTDADHSTSSTVARASFSRRRDSTIAVEGIWITNAPCCSGEDITDTLSSVSYPSVLQCRLYSSRGARTPRFSDNQTLEENVKAAYNHINILSYQDVAAFWTIVSKIQKQDGRRAPEKQTGGKMEMQKMSEQLDKILCHTFEGVGDHDSRGLAQTTLALAKIVENLEGRGKGMSNRSPHNQILHGLLIGNNSEIKKFIFQELALASMPILREFDARHLSNFIYAFGLVKHTHEFEDGSTFFDMLALVAMPNFKRFSSQGLSNMLWAYANAGVSNSQLFKNAGDVIERGSLETFAIQAVSNILWAYATLNESHPKLFKKMANHIVALDNLGGFKPQHLSIIVWAFATAEETHPKLFKRIADHIMALSNLGTFDPQAHANIVWAYATLDEPHPKLFKKVADHIMALNNLGTFKSQELSNIVWAYATAEESHPKLYKKVADHNMALNNLGKFKSQELSNTVWAYAKANESHPKLFKNVAGHIMALNNLGTFAPQAHANIVWAYATAEESHPELFNKIADHIEALNNLGTFKSQELSNTVWAYAKANESHPKLFNKIANHVVSLESLVKFNSQSLSNIVWAYASADEPHPKIFKKVADHIMALNNLGTFDPQALANIAWAYATANESHPVLFHKLAEAAIQRQARFNSREIANFLWAHAANGHMDENLFQTLAPLADALLDKCNEQDLANIAWAFAVVNVSASSLFDENFVKACKDKEYEFTVRSLFQLHQWQIWQEELKSSMTLHPSLSKRCHEAFVSRVPTPSALQGDVISELKAIGLRPEEEVLTRRGYRLDAVVEVDGNKIGMEVDGPSHFLGRRPTGSTMLKRRQVASVEGLPVLSVPYWEWNKLKRNSDKKQKYLCSLLDLSQS